MKKLLAVAMTLMLAVSMSAQKDVTKFLGIPVDGTKAEMIRKLKAKGFTSTTYDKDELEGQFNGYSVTLSVVTNKDKVYRVVVMDAYSVDETNIKIRYNNLCYQFSKNINYISVPDQSIPEGEDISYEMLVNNKRYEAAYYQHNNDNIQKQFRAHINIRYTDDEILNPTEAIQAEMDEYMGRLLEPARYKCVWFCIKELGGEYRIVMYYDNRLNQADGEDL